MAEEIGLLPPIRSYAEFLVDSANSSLGSNQKFWKVASVRDAAHAIKSLTAEAVPTELWEQAIRDAKGSPSEDLEYGIFQIITQNFAYSASLEPKLRRFIGIRKGLFR